MSEIKMEMKAWQKGTPIEDLREIVSFYDIYHNRLTFSPFVQVNKRTVADMLDRDILKINSNAAYCEKVFKARSAIKAFDDKIYMF